MGWPTLTTDRLVLRPLAMDDLDDLAALHAEESFWRYPFGRGWSRDETESFLQRQIERYQDPGIAVSAVVVADTGELAGWAGLSIPTFLPEILPAVEVGWRLGERHRGHGYATEAGRAWIAYGFDQLGLESIVSIYEPDNIASGAVMRRLGFTLERQTRHPTFGTDIHVLSLSHPTWRSPSRPPPPHPTRSPLTERPSLNCCGVDPSRTGCQPGSMLTTSTSNASGASGGMSPLPSLP